MLPQCVLILCSSCNLAALCSYCVILCMMPTACSFCFVLILCSVLVLWHSRLMDACLVRVQGASEPEAAAGEEEPTADEQEKLAAVEEELVQ